MRLLVAGGARVDAGKTTFSTGLVARTGAVGFKPRAGNDYWFDHDDFLQATADGRLYGKDARKLAAASAADVTPEDINAVHRLWRPSPGGGTGLLGKEDREFLVDRVGDLFVVNGTVELSDSVREALPLADAPRVSSVEEFNELMTDRHLPEQRSLLAEIEATERAVVESYADVARPFREIDPDAVAVVEPGRVRVYDGDRYAKGCAIASGGPDAGQLEERVGDVTDLIEPKADARLPPLSKAERGDPAAVADAYEHAYDAVLAAAFE
ncbi:ATPase [Halosimplex pelagicum]|uniref:ATPase n=1 Tax=Halosimplex pelagicum TaxID=869886 RepID=A0A7D5P9Y7_9EURY|nr:ATPase [Halosimplex pelagicum]QLH84397.1 ATPase [Halosimplex pelagicum]